MTWDKSGIFRTTQWLGTSQVIDSLLYLRGFAGITQVSATDFCAENIIVKIIWNIQNCDIEVQKYPVA